MKLLDKNKQIKRNNYSIVKMLMPSLIGICVCVICFLGTTFAWFTDNVSISTQSIQAADYWADVEIKDENGIVQGNGGTYTLSRKEEGKGYEVSITSRGAASIGFCIINDNLITKEINKGDTLTFTLYPNRDNKEYTFTSMWGTYSTLKNGTSRKYSKIKNGDIIGTPLRKSDLGEVNNNLETPNVEKVEQNNPQPEKTETITPSEETTEEMTEEENEIMENDLSETDNENYDTP